MLETQRGFHCLNPSALRLRVKLPKHPTQLMKLKLQNAPNVVTETEGTDLSTSPPECTNLPSVPAEVPITSPDTQKPRRYPTRMCSKPKRLIEEM